MTVKIDGTEPNVFPAVEGVDVRDAGRNAELILGTKIEGKLTPVRRRSLRREYGSSRMHWRSRERPAMVGAEPNKMRLGKHGTCLAFGHAGWRAISQ
jgi:hypothetical protein